MKMKTNKILIIDFDSTIIQVEGLEELAKIALRDREDEAKVLAEIIEITNQGMEGKIPFGESLQKRVDLLDLEKKHIQEVVGVLREKITPSIKRNQDFFKLNQDYIYIVSGGFGEFIEPIINELGFKPDNLLANSFIINERNKVSGIDKTKLLSIDQGKVKAIADLKLNAEICVVGDGYTDYEIRESGLAQKFIVFTENITRPNVLELADEVAESFEQVISKL